MVITDKFNRVGSVSVDQWIAATEIEPLEIDSIKVFVTIHGVLTEVSPVKQSRKNPNTQYFMGQISNGKKTLQMVSFDRNLLSLPSGASLTILHFLIYSLFSLLYRYFQNYLDNLRNYM